MALTFIRAHWARLAEDTAGSSAAIIAFGMMIMVGVSAMVIDLGLAHSVHTRLQTTADAAALAGVSQLPDEAAAVNEAVSYASKNMGGAVHGAVLSASDVAAGNWDAATRNFTAQGTPKNAIRVLTRRMRSAGNPLQTLFARIIGVDEIDIGAASIAARNAGPPACIIALNPSVSRAFYVQGNALVRTYDCDIQVNSCHAADAIRAQGNVDILVEDLVDPEDFVRKVRTCGSVATNGPATIDPAPVADTGEQAADPFAGVDGPDPSIYDDAGDCDFNNFSATGTVDLTPGVYCGGIQLSGNGIVTLGETGGSLTNGLYIIKDGQFSVTGNIDVVGNGVTIFMTGSAANINFGGTADIGLLAPTSGGLTGFVIFGDRDNPATLAHEIRGTALGGYDGYVYLPGAIAEFQGTATGTLGAVTCTIFVADTFYFHGTPNVEARADCSQYGLLGTATAKLVR